MEELEKAHTRVVTSAKESVLKNAIHHMLSREGENGMSATSILQELSDNGIKLEYKGLLYKCLSILTRSDKIEKFYSPKRRCVVYRIKDVSIV